MSLDPRVLEDWAGALLAAFSPSERRALSNAIARDLRASQRKRIARQRNPDGSAYARRKRPRSVRSRPVRFLYRKPNGEERIAEMRSWSYQGQMFIGYDREADGIRSFYRDRVVRFLRPGSSASGDGMRRRRGRLKRESMFRKIGTAAHLRTHVDADSVAAGFVGRTARLARVHQFGLQDAARPGAPPVTYPRRELLGLTDEDLERIQSRLFARLSG